MREVKTHIRHEFERGWTLLELIVVLLVLGILAVMVAPRFGGSDGFAEHAYQARLISALRTMQQRAMQDSRQGDRANICYQVNIAAGANSAFGPPTLNYLDTSLLNVILTCSSTKINEDGDADYISTTSTEMSEAGVQINGSSLKIEFDTMGCTIDSGVSCQFDYRVEIQGQRALAVCVNPQGYIYACD